MASVAPLKGVAAPTVDLTELARAAKAITATASSSPSDGKYLPKQVVDGDWTSSSTDAWHSDPNGGTNQWLACQFSDSFESGRFIMVLSYSIYYNQAWCGAGTSQYPRKLPRAWTFEGSNDGVTWTTLDTHQDWNGWTKNAWNTFSVSDAVGCFRHYRLNMTATCNGYAAHQYYVIPELKLYGKVFDTQAEASALRVWLGGSGNGSWNDAAEWSEGTSGQTVPGSEDSVVIPVGSTVTLSESNANCSYVEVAGTIVMTNWTTRFSATDIAIPSGGNITCGAAVTNEAWLSRVWVSCSNLTIASGGKIDVNYRGYAGHEYVATKYFRGYGPGGSYVAGGNYSCGASHGGHGGRTIKLDYVLPIIMPYDDPTAPELPGSSGAAGYGAGGRNGGGAVKIEATGSVVVDGSILANGANASSYGTVSSSTTWSFSGTQDNHDQAGAGGSIFIECRTFAGAGTLSAVGGGGCWPFSSVPSHPAGGGMIAMHYDREAEQSVSVDGMTITADSGQHLRYLKDKIDVYRSTNVDDKYDDKGVNAGMGTIHFTDDRIAQQLAGKTLTGNILGITNFVHEGDWNFTGGRVMFGEEGVNVRVNGNLTFSGSDSRLEIGGGVVTNWDSYIVMYAGTNANSLTVTGDLTLGGVSRLDIRAAATNGVERFGSYVKVGGTMTISTNCFVYSWSDRRNLGSPHFEVGSLDVQTGGVLSAAHRGGRGSYRTHTTYYGTDDWGIGPGSVRSSNYTQGASHGGKGGGGAAKATYGDALRPVLPGSGGAAYWNQYTVSGSGGGLIWVTATNGTIRVDGTMDASGRDGNLIGSGYGGGGSGGSILLEAKRFFGGETGRLVAIGGNTTPYSTVSSGAGGGGRIAVWCGAPWSANLRKSRKVISETPLTDYPESMSYLGSYSVDGGIAVGDYAETKGFPGGVGTVRFCLTKPPQGNSVILR